MFKYLCGHQQEQAPANMGRGAARDKCLAQYFGRTCLQCTLERVAHEARRLTDVHGKRLPQEVEEANVTRWQQRVRRLY